MANENVAMPVELRAVKEFFGSVESKPPISMVCQFKIDGDIDLSWYLTMQDGAATEMRRGTYGGPCVELHGSTQRPDLGEIDLQLVGGDEVQLLDFLILVLSVGAADPGKVVEVLLAAPVRNYAAEINR